MKVQLIERGLILSKGVLIRRCLLPINYANQLLTDDFSLQSNTTVPEEFLIALKQANPEVFNQFYRWKAGSLIKQKKVRNIRLSLTNYLLRAATRATPFGLFGEIQLGVSNNEQLKNENSRKTTMLVCLPTIKTEPIERLTKNDTVLANPSIYEFGEKFILETMDKEGDTSSIPVNELTKAVLTEAKQGGKVNFLIKIVQSITESTSREALSFLEGLFEEQFLLEEKNRLINSDSFSYLYSKGSLEKKQLGSIHTNNGNAIRVRTDISIIDSHLKDSVIEAIKFLFTTNFVRSENSKWRQLCDFFNENLQFDKIPIMQIVMERQIPEWENQTPEDTDLKTTENYGILLDLCQRSLLQSEMNVDLKLNGQLFNKKTNIGVTADFLFSIFKKGDCYWTILDEGVGSPEFGKIVNRFYNQINFASGHVFELQREFTKRVEKSNTEVIDAGVVFKSPNSTIFNITQTDNPFEFEIPINCFSSKDEQHTLNLDSLVVGVDENKELYLWSEQLKREIHPRFLNSATLNSNFPKVVRFLSEIAKNRFPYFETMFPSSDPQLKSSVYPRISLGNIILSRASWKIDHKFLEDAEESFEEAVLSWRQRFNIPKIIGLTTGEAPTVYNFENKDHLLIIEKQIRKFMKDGNLSRVKFVEMPEIENSSDLEFIEQLVVSAGTVDESNDVLVSHKQSNYVSSSLTRNTLVPVTPDQGMVSIILLLEFMADEVGILMKIKEKVGDNFFFVNYFDNGSRSIRLRFIDVKGFTGKFWSRLFDCLSNLVRLKSLSSF